MTGSKIWAPPPHSLKIEMGEVHVWRAELDRADTAVQELRETLGADEMDRANRFHFERHRRDFIVGRGLLRYLIGLYVEAEPAALKFCYGLYGKPALEGLHKLRFNMSHSHGVALFAFSEGMDVGVDVEHIRADFASEDIARRFFSAVEVTNLCALTGEVQVEAFFRCWTRKEAFIKVTGRGLSQSLDGFDVTLAPAVPAALLRVSDDEAERWELFDVEVGEGYAGALAVEGKVSGVQFWELE
jgi:4'-phosphopantetheinyl transferase